MYGVKTLIPLLLAVSLAQASDRISEESAVAQLKKTTASQLDPSLPARSFGSWVTDKFRDWNIQWELHECGQVTMPTRKGDASQEGPVCVQVNIMQPGQKMVRGEPVDGYQLLFLVGTEKHGLMPTPRLQAATHNEGNEVQRLHGLSEVEP